MSDKLPELAYDHGTLYIDSGICPHIAYLRHVGGELLVDADKWGPRIVAAVNQHEKLVEALKAAGHGLNLGLGMAYENGAPFDTIRCNICHRNWPVHVNEDRTAGAKVEHDPAYLCGITQDALNKVDEVLGDL
jgi:hypothetical protein